MEDMTSKSSGRTRIRDPRKAKSIQSSVGVAANKDSSEHLSTSNNKYYPPLQRLQQSNALKPQMPFEPSVQNQQSLGLGSYMLAGVGVAIGVTLVSAIFGAIG
jgi:hypothetical protein